MRRILTFLGEHVRETPPLDELAAMAAMSRSHFSRMFHAAIGVRLRDYIRDLRLSRAREMLLVSRLSLTTIAIEAGFYDLPHFDKAFRRRFGMSPHAFRHRHARRPGDDASARAGGAGARAADLPRSALGQFDVEGAACFRLRRATRGVARLGPTAVRATAGEPATAPAVPVPRPRSQAA